MASASTGVIVLYLVLGCGGGGTQKDAHPGEPDAGSDAVESLEVGDDSFAASNVDARLGIAGGSSCDASAQCLSGACTLGVCSDWAHVMRIGIDTGVIDIEEAVTNFPLLVRLGAENFTFSDVNPDGSDIRFLDSSGVDLNYEIERWSPNLAKAEIWVQVPLVAAGSPDNFILMYWGNPLAIPTSSGPSVFADQTCVLHLAQDPNSGDRQIADASGKGNNGLVQAKSGDAFRGDGVAGFGLVLDGGGAFLATSSQLSSPSTFSISLWLKTSSATGGGIAVFNGSQWTDSPTHDRMLWMDASGRLSFSVMRGGKLAVITTPTGYNDDTWHFLAARLSRSGQFLFVDGEPVAGDTTTISADSYLGYWRFGEAPVTTSPSSTPTAPEADSNFFSGAIDEVRVATNTPSDDWITLSFATQLPDSAAVSYLPQP
jgi:hypothetical protein